MIVDRFLEHCAALRAATSLTVLLAVLLSESACTRAGTDAAATLHHPDDQRNATSALLGSDELFSGIPGDGPLTNSQIKAWLAEESNHQSLTWQLPPGLQQPAHPATVPEDNPLTRAKIELGRQLFFDHRLSENERLSCSDCHHPLRAFSADLIGHERLREPPVIFNRIFSSRQFWDGRAGSLEEQPIFAIQNPDELNSTLDAAVARIAAIEGYRLQFERIFGEVDTDGIGQALASFQRAVVTGPSPWDLQRTSDTAENDRNLSLSAGAIRGSELFFSGRVGCSRCHAGDNLSDETFHNVGSAKLPPLYGSQLTGPLIRPRREEDTGRMQVTGDKADFGQFKTPTLRNVSRTPPYLHDGRFLSLEAAVDFFLRGGDDDNTELQAVELTAEERRDLLEFLAALESPLPKIEQGRLPK